MDELELLRVARPAWLEQTLASLTLGTALKNELRHQLEIFYSAVEQIIETGNPAWLDSILSSWAGSMKPPGIEEPSSSLSQFISKLMLASEQVYRETLSEKDALRLNSVMQRCFAYAYEKVALFETQMRINAVIEQLTQAQETIERLDRSKSDFITIAAHELKTPLTLIDGYASMLNENIRLRDPQSPDLELLKGIFSGARRMRSIIDDMIDVSLIDNDRLELNFQPIWFSQLFEHLRNELRVTLENRGLEFIIHPFEGSQEMTFGDPERLMQVFRNLITNAIKYTPDGGKIKTDGRKLPGFLEITVSDTGIGIAPEDQIIIFGKFGRLGDISHHSSGKTKFKGGGPGLGLHIARGIVESHGGTIWVESAGYDETSFPGAAFHVLLPLRNRPPDDELSRIYEPLMKNELPNGEKSS